MTTGTSNRRSRGTPRPAAARPLRPIAGRRMGAGRRAVGEARDRGLASARRRFERRASRVRHRPWRVAAAAVVVVVLLAVGVWVVGASSLLAVRTVSVTGLTDARERAAVVAAASVLHGTPLARVDTAGAADRVAQIPTVSEVEVSRSWPSTITVTVTRRQPVLAVRLPDSRLQLVDATGRAYSTVAAAPKGVPLVSSSAATPDPEGLRAAASVLTLLPATLRSTVSGVTVSSADLVTFVLGGVTVRWGGLADGSKKLAVLRALLRTSPTTVDVSAPDTPTTT